MADATLYLGNRNYSSWSLRGWLAAKASGLDFEDVVIPLRQAETRETILKYAPSGRVPVLRHGEFVVWDSLAIAEYLAETFPEARLWPEDPTARALARAVSAEMHAGFANLREALPMNVRASYPDRAIDPDTQADINRITALWRDARKRFGAEGAFLFGAFSIADAMYAPVASRFRTYAVALEESAQAYVEALHGHPAMQEWAAAARNEPMVVDEFEHD